MAEIKILWSDQSVDDLEDIIAYIARDSAAVAKNFAAKIIDAVDVLETFPSVGRIVPEYNDPNIREILYRNYRIVYQLSESTATVVTIFHGSRPFA